MCLWEWMIFIYISHGTGCLVLFFSLCCSVCFLFFFCCLNFFFTVIQHFVVLVLLSSFCSLLQFASTLFLFFHSPPSPCSLWSGLASVSVPSIPMFNFFCFILIVSCALCSALLPPLTHCVIVYTCVSLAVSNPPITLCIYIVLVWLYSRCTVFLPASIPIFSCHLDSILRTLFWFTHSSPVNSLFCFWILPPGPHFSHSTP